MIKLDRPAEPEILAANKAAWLANLTAAVTKYGSYKDIPDAEKEKLICFYRHNDIKSALEKSSHGKCAFCETKPGESGNVEVEHFAPKSIYYSLTFDWSNLLPCCRKCNGAKGTHDTIKDPILNPYSTDPRNYFYFEDISMKPIRGPNFEIARQTVQVCRLDGARLFRPRALLLVTVRQFIADLEDALDSFKDAESKQARSIRLRKLSESIERIENSMHPSESHSSFVRSIVEFAEAYIEAKKLIEADQRV